MSNVTPEMIGAGMREWDKQHGAGVRSWPAMLEAVYVAMQAEDKRIAAALNQQAGAMRPTHWMPLPEPPEVMP